MYRLVGVLFSLSGLMIGCTPEQESKSTDSGTTSPDTDTVETTHDSAEPEPEEEVCDGEDNDGDGEVDEGFDDNADGIGDCLQCTVDSTTSVDGGVSTAQCQPRSEQKDIWEAELSWSYNHKGADFNGACLHPRIADLNGDGFGDIVCSGWGKQEIYAIDGNEHNLMWEFSGTKSGTSSAVVDVEGDGDWDVLTLTREDRLTVLSHQGISGRYSEETVSGSHIYNLCIGQPLYCNNYDDPITVADLDRDGDWEIITMAAIISARTLEVTSWFDLDYAGEVYDYFDWYSYGLPHADLDDDGIDEVIVAEAAYNIDGSKRWSAPVDPNSTDIRTSAVIVQADSDSAAEVAFLRKESFSVVDGDGSLINYVSTEERHSIHSAVQLTNVGHSCAGDLDGDGETELIISTQVEAFTQRDAPSVSVFSAWELSGEFLWSIRHPNASRAMKPPACHVFDFNGDGLDEVVYNDEEGVHIVHGNNGAEALSIPPPKGADSIDMDQTLIADLDGDGSVELIVAYSYGGGALPSVEVYRHPDGRWPIGSRIWPTEAWSGTGMDSQGAPQNEQSRPWQSPGMFRGQTQVHVEGIDVQPVIHDACVAEAEVRLSVGAENLGPNDLTSQVRFVVSQPDGTVLDEASLTRGVAAGSGSETVEFVLSPELAAEGLVVELSTPDAADCNPTNNALSWSPEDH